MLSRCLVPFGGLGGGFAPRHLSRSAASLGDGIAALAQNFCHKIKLLDVYVVETRKLRVKTMSEIENRNAEGLTRRSFLTNTAATLVGLMLGAKASSQQPASKTYEFINGQWFDGQGFKGRKFYLRLSTF